MNDDHILSQQLDRLCDEHQQIEAQIEEQMKGAVINSFVIQKLKKKKLILKDQIEILRSRLFPDIIA